MTNRAAVLVKSSTVRIRRLSETENTEYQQCSRETIHIGLDSTLSDSRRRPFPGYCNSLQKQQKSPKKRRIATSAPAHAFKLERGNDLVRRIR